MSTVIKAKHKPTVVAAMFFGGKNSKDVAEFVREYSGATAKAGGSYVSIMHDRTILALRALKNDWVVVDSDGTIKLLNIDEFNSFFRIVDTKNV